MGLYLFTEITTKRSAYSFIIIFINAFVLKVLLCGTFQSEVLEIMIEIYLLIVGSFLLCLGFLWSWTSIKTTQAKAEVDKVIATQEAKVQDNIAQIGLETKRLEVAGLDRKGDRDSEINDKNLHFKTTTVDKTLENGLERERIVQQAKSSRTELKCMTKLSRMELDYDYRNRKEANNVKMFGQQLTLQERSLESSNLLKEAELKLQLKGIKLESKTRMWEADKHLDKVKVVQEHEDGRLERSLATGLQMNRERLQVKGFLGERQIEANRELKSMKYEYQTFRDAQQTARAPIEAEHNPLNNLLNVGLAIIGTGRCPGIGSAGKLLAPAAQNVMAGGGSSSLRGSSSSLGHGTGFEQRLSLRDSSSSGSSLGQGASLGSSLGGGLAAGSSLRRGLTTGSSLGPGASLWSSSEAGSPTGSSLRGDLNKRSSLGKGLSGLKLDRDYL